MKNNTCSCGAEIIKESKTCSWCGAELTFMGKMKFMILTSIVVLISAWWLYLNK